MASSLIITEKQLLKYYKDFGKDLPNSFTSKENRFVSEIGRDLFKTYQDLISQDYDLLDEHILTKTDSKNIDKDVLDQINETSYQVEKVKEYEKELNTAFYCDQISDEIFTNLPKITEKKNNHNIEELKKTIDNINSLYSSIENTGKQELYTVKEYMELGYEEELEKRFNGIPQTTGCDHLDSLLMNRVSAGLMTIGGWSGSGKTSSVLGTVFSSRLIKNLPQAWMGTELSKLAMQDHLMAMIGEVQYKDLFEEVDIEVNESNNDNPRHDKVLRALNNLKKRMEKFNRTLICGSSTISTKQIKSIILNARKQVNCGEDELFVFEIDLLSMVKEFSNSGNGLNRADGIELAVNEVNNIALETNTLIIGTVQLRRKEIKEITNPSDLQKYRPTRFDIKSAGAYVERSRYVLLIVNDYDTIRKSNSSDFIIDLVSADPVIEMVLDKCTYAETGKSIFYHVDWEYRRFYPAKNYECPWMGLEEN